MIVKKSLSVSILTIILPLISESQTRRPVQPALGAHSAPIIQRGGFKFRDLNKNGILDPYEDWRLSPDKRAMDLVSRMTLEEKAGMMMHGTARTARRRGARRCARSRWTTWAACPTCSPCWSTAACG